MNLRRSLPLSTSGVMIHVPRQAPPTTFEAVEGEASAVKAPATPPTMQKLAFTGE